MQLAFGAFGLNLLKYQEARVGSGGPVENFYEFVGIIQGFKPELAANNDSTLGSAPPL